MSRKASAEAEERRGRLARTEERIASLVRFIAEGDHSQYVRQALLDLEAQAKAEKVALSDLRAGGSAAVRLPSPEETVERALRFEEMLLRHLAGRREPLRGRRRRAATAAWDPCHPTSSTNVARDRPIAP
jgi:hypothetical protein